MTRIYLDQNILGAVRKGLFCPATLKDFIWVYSDEHFNEISRGGDTSYLAVLQELKAQQLKIHIDHHGRIKDEASLIEGCPFEVYQTYLESNGGAQVDETLLTDFVARLAGADNYDAIRALPKRFRNQLEILLPRRHHERSLKHLLDHFESSIVELVGHLTEQRSLTSLRTSLGTNGGRAGNVSSDNAIPELYKIMRENCGGVSIDQIFGLSSTADSKYLAIVACHTMLNFVGYNPTKASVNPPRFQGS
jgi:hypothetical protein